MNDINIEQNILAPEVFFRKVDLANQNTSNTRSCPESFLNIVINDLTLENKHLIRSEFSYSKVRNVTFRSIDLEGAEFNYTDLDEVVFVRCKLTRSSFNFARMRRNVRFIECLMFRSSFDYASGKATFDHCDVHGVEFHHVQEETALNFCQCAGQCIEFNYSPDLIIRAEDCDFHEGQFNDSRISGRLSQCILTNSDFLNSDCIGIDFQGCTMREMNIDGSSGVICGDEEEEKFGIE